ncbi:MAG: ferritin-like domain-containing protein [Alphaproteobacteria bacterium]|nr:ferritin-like domain-containing protein [Alphaproteobacteria bacterium]
MDMENLYDLFVEQLRDIYYAENQLLKALKKMSEKATCPDLSAAYSEHLEETRGQIETLERVMQSLDLEVKGEKCEAIMGILKEADELISETENEAVRDAAMILAAQKVEHYEIATYGTLCAFADCLGLDAQAELLRNILAEERSADEKLTKLAMNLKNGVNKTAMQEAA